MSQKPRICLSMIVKNESHVIKQTLENISKYIDYYVINDTGSTDGTQSIIKEYFDSIDIPGEIIDHEFRSCSCHMGTKWKKYSFFHFGWNRSYALKQCEGKSDYIFVFDADDLIVGNMNLDNLTKDCYNLKIGKGFTYVRPLIFKNDSSFNWHFEDPLHEYATCDKSNYTKETITGDYYVESRRLGARNQDKNKYLRDAQVFEELLQENPNNDRHTFYCAQSYYDHKDYENAIKFYRKRITLGKWYEEVFYSYYRIAQALENLKRPCAEVKKAYLDAYNYCKDRAEPLYSIAKYYRHNSNFKQGYKYAKLASQIPYPDQCTLFVYKDIYDYRILDELMTNAFHLENYQETYSIARKLLNSNNVPKEEIDRIKNNLNASKTKIEHMNKKSCLIYTGNMTLNKDASIYKLIKILTKTHKTILVGNKIDIYSYKNTYISSIKSMKECLKDNPNSLEIDYLILCDCVDYYYENFNITPKTTILLQQDHIIKNSFENGLLVGIRNSEYLNKIFEKLSIGQIMCKNKEIADQLSEFYKINRDTLRIINFEDKNNYYEIFNVTTQKYIFNFEINDDTNGLIYLEPDCLNYIRENKKAYPFNNQLLINYYTEIQKKQPFILEHIGKLALTHFELGDNDKALASLETAISLIKENKSYQAYKDVLQLTKSRVLYTLEKYQEAYDLCNIFLQKTTIPENIRIVYEQLRDSIATEHLYDAYLTYPQSIIKPIQNKNTKNVIFVTFNGEHFEKTMNSFLNCCTDLIKIDYWLCIDDFKNKINKKYPFFDCVVKKNNSSLNFMREKAINGKYTYLLYVPPNWQFIQKRDYIQECLDIMASNDKICSVSLNKSNSHNNLSLSFIRVSALNDTGIFYNTDNSEKEYIYELQSRDYKLTSIDTLSAIDLLILEKPKIHQSNLLVKVISDSNDANIWKRFKETTAIQLPNINRIIPKDTINLNNDEKELFIGNDFNYLRSVIKKILSHIEILKEESNHNYTLVLNERVILKNECKSILNSILNSKTSYDFIMLDNNFDDTQTNTIIKKNIPISLEKLNGYIISKEGKKKLLEYIRNNKIKSRNYLENQTAVETYILNKKLYDVGTTDNTILPNTDQEFVELEGYKFYSLMDSYGHDSGSYGRLSIQELKAICDKNGDAGFNTLGWIKHTITQEKDFINLPNTTNPADGLYVKI